MDKSKPCNIAPRIDLPAPDFKGYTFFKRAFRKTSLKKFKGKWLVLFFYPMDFTFVCPTEIKAFNEMAPKFKEINCEILGCSVDSKFVHRQWSKTPLSEGGVGPLTFPLLADLSKEICSAYGCLVTEGPDKGAAFR